MDFRLSRLPQGALVFPGRRVVSTRPSASCSLKGEMQARHARFASRASGVRSDSNSG